MRAMFKFLRRRIKEAEEAIEKAEKEEKKGLFGISEKKIDELLWELELALLEADVALEVVEKIKAEIKKRLVGSPRREAKELVERALKEAIKSVLESSEGNFFEIVEKKEKPVVIMFVGVNGSGKTTAIAKLAHHFIKSLCLLYCIVAS